MSIEDPFDQDDWPAWSQFTGSVGIQVSCHVMSLLSVSRLEVRLEVNPAAGWITALPSMKMVSIDAAEVKIS